MKTSEVKTSEVFITFFFVLFYFFIFQPIAYTILFFTCMIGWFLSIWVDEWILFRIARPIFDIFYTPLILMAEDSS